MEAQGGSDLECNSILGIESAYDCLGTLPSSLAYMSSNSQHQSELQLHKPAKGVVLRQYGRSKKPARPPVTVAKGLELLQKFGQSNEQRHNGNANNQSLSITSGEKCYSLDSKILSASSVQYLEGADIKMQERHSEEVKVKLLNNKSKKSDKRAQNTQNKTEIPVRNLLPLPPGRPGTPTELEEERLRKEKELRIRIQTETNRREVLRHRREKYRKTRLGETPAEREERLRKRREQYRVKVTPANREEILRNRREQYRNKVQNERRQLEEELGNDQVSDDGLERMFEVKQDPDSAETDNQQEIELVPFSYYNSDRAYGRLKKSPPSSKAILSDLDCVTCGSHFDKYDYLKLHTELCSLVAKYKKEMES